MTDEPILKPVRQSMDRLDVRQVRMFTETMEKLASRDLDGNRVIWSWGGPDGEGFYSPSATLDLSDNIVTKALEGVEPTAADLTKALRISITSQGLTMRHGRYNDAWWDRWGEELHQALMRVKAADGD